MGFLWPLVIIPRPLTHPAFPFVAIRFCRSSRAFGPIQSVLHSDSFGCICFYFIRWHSKNRMRAIWFSYFDPYQDWLIGHVESFQASVCLFNSTLRPRSNDYVILSSNVCGHRTFFSSSDSSRRNSLHSRTDGAKSTLNWWTLPNALTGWFQKLFWNVYILKSYDDVIQF